MVLQIIAFILVLAIVYYQVVQGLFSALIMMMLTILCAAVAFEYYEPVAQALLYERQGPHAEAASLLVLFVLPLLGLRLIFDRLIAGNVVMGLWVDRIGGGAVGLVTALILVGVFCIVLVMLPFGESIIGYTSHDRALQEDQGLLPMSFTLGLVDTLSDLGLSGGTKLSDKHPDLLLDAFCARNTGGKSGRLDAPTDAMKVIGIFEPGDKAVHFGLPGQRVATDNDPTRRLSDMRYPLMPRTEPQKIVIVRTSVSQDARSESEKDNWWRLPGTHFRLVSQTSRSYYPIGYLTALTIDRINPKAAPKPKEADWVCHIPLDNDDKRPLLADLVVERSWHRQGGPEDLIVDWVYAIGKDEKIDRIVFRRVAIEDVAGRKGSGPWPLKPKCEEGVLRLAPVQR